MSCTSPCCGISGTFDRKKAEADLRQYRLKGPDPVTRLLLDAIAAAGKPAGSVLDVGSGVGIVAFELLARGASSATLVEASRPSLDAAREEAARRDLLPRLSLVEGDFVEVAPELGPADVVVLNRVICCYPEMAPLVRRSADLTRQLYAAVYPRDSWWVKALTALENLVRRLRRNPFRTMVHPERAIEAELRAAGLRPRSLHRGAIWVTGLFERCS